ncbi:MAG TPA: archease [Enhygromyxa sp.]|nr:archease [Enhygromyxa sp.]
MGERWEHFEHGADVGVRGIGATPAAAFEQIALAMTAIVTDLHVLEVLDQFATIELEATSLDELLFDWLDALVFEMSTRAVLFARFEVEIQDHRLRARMWGAPVDRVRHEPAVEIKGPTYTQLRVAPDQAGGWLAQCVVDV